MSSEQEPVQQQPEPNPATSEQADTSGRRDEQGRFAKGHCGGPGNPYARQVARLRKAALEAVSDRDVHEIFQALKQRAKEGDVAAAKLVLSYTIGKPSPAPDPDLLDCHEFETISRNTVPGSEGVVRILQGMPMELLLKILRAALPAMAPSKQAIAAAMFRESLEQDQQDEEACEEEQDEADDPAQEREVPECLQEILDREAGRERTTAGTENTESASCGAAGRGMRGARRNSRPLSNGGNGGEAQPAPGVNRLAGQGAPERNGRHR